MQGEQAGAHMGWEATCHVGQESWARSSSSGLRLDELGQFDGEFAQALLDGNGTSLVGLVHRARTIAGPLEVRMTAPTSAAAVAARLLAAAEYDGRQLTNLQLQKLVFLVQSESLATLDAPAFREPVQAWNHGPVVRPLYGMYKKYREQPITTADTSALSRLPVSEAVLAATADVWELFGDLSGSALWRLTHAPGRVWEQNYAADVRGIELPADQIARDWESYRGSGEALRLAREARVAAAEERHPSLGTAQWPKPIEEYESLERRFCTSRPPRSGR